MKVNAVKPKGSVSVMSRVASGIEPNPCGEIPLSAIRPCAIKHAMSYIIPHLEQLHLFEPTPKLAWDIRENFDSESLQKVMEFGAQKYRGISVGYNTKKV